jgi:hypothetical protein
VSADAVARCDCDDPYDIAACADGAAARMDAAEQPPVVWHARKVVNGWGSALCGADEGLLVDKQASCPDCIRMTRALVTSERDDG